MKNFKAKDRKGISMLGALLFVLLLILVLSYFNVKVKNVVESPAARENFDYVEGQTKTFWEERITPKLHYFWNDIVINILWDGVTSNIKRIRNGEPTDFDKAVQKVQYRE